MNFTYDYIKNIGIKFQRLKCWHSTCLNKLNKTNELISNIVKKDLNAKNVNIESTDIESTDIESTDIESIPVESIPVESIPVESTDIESTDIESTDIESTDIESTDIESIPAKSAFISNKITESNFNSINNLKHIDCNNIFEPEYDYCL